MSRWYGPAWGHARSTGPGLSFRLASNKRGCTADGRAPPILTAACRQSRPHGPPVPARRAIALLGGYRHHDDCLARGFAGLSGRAFGTGRAVAAFRTGRAGGAGRTSRTCGCVDFTSAHSERGDKGHRDDEFHGFLFLRRANRVA